MAISTVKTGTHYTWTDGSSFTITGIESGDFVLIIGAADNSSVAIDPPSGFTLGDRFTDDSPDSMWAYDFATGTSLSVTSLTGDTGGGSQFEGVGYLYIVLRGVDSTTPINDSSNASQGSDSTSINPAAVTTTVDNAWVIPIGVLDDQNTASSVSPPSGYTTIANYDVPDNNGTPTPNFGATIMTAYLEKTSAGSEDPGSFTFSASDQARSFTIALAPTVVIDLISTGNISLDEVRTYLELATTSSLQDCFTTAETFGRDFDPIYEGSKDRLSNFKGYGTPTPPPPPTLPTVESYSAATTGGSASTNITFSSAPSGLTAGDLILILIANERNNDWLFQNETGYTRVTLASNANDVQLGIYYRIATGDANDGFPNLTIQHCTSNEFAVGWALRISGVDTSDPIPIFGTYQVGIGSTQTVPSITTTTDDSLAIMFVGLDGSDVDPITITAGTGWTSGDFAQDDGGDQTVGVYGEWYTKEMSTAGATGTVSMSHGNDGWAGLQLAIKPA